MDAAAIASLVQGMMETQRSMANMMEGVQATLALLAQSGGGQQGQARGDDQSAFKLLINTRVWKTFVFEGEQAKWTEWSFQFYSGMRSSCLKSVDKLRSAERADYDDMADMGDPFVDKLTAELFDILIQYCRGEAGEVVRSVEDGNGLLAWHKLFEKYNPRTASRMIAIVQEVVSPPKIVHSKDFEHGIRLWLMKEKSLREEFGQTLQDGIQTAIITNMLPTKIRDTITMNISGSWTKATLLEKVRGMISNMISGPTAMDNNMDVCETAECFEDCCDEEVGAISMNSQCHNCSGYGHFSRDCPSQKKGKGKGTEWAGKGVAPPPGYQLKGYPKGGYKGKADKGGAKGLGKAFTGECYKCGRRGHRAADCRVATANGVGEEEEEVTQIGGNTPTWHVGSVNCGNKHAKELVKPVKTSNRFDALLEDLVVVKRKQKPSTPHLPNHGSTPHLPNHGSTPYLPNHGSTPHLPNHGSTPHLPNHGSTPKIPKIIRSAMKIRPAAVQINEVFVQQVSAEELTSLSSIMFHVTDSVHPLASCGAVCKAGNRVVLDLEHPEGSYVENKSTKERMRLYLSDQNTFKFDVQYPDGSEGAITLDSGAGASVWPHAMQPEVPRLKSVAGLRLIAANGTEIANYGRAAIKFRGVRSKPVFARRP
jgi:hypothetical protein